tara:strand:- start:93 stop:1013 length:921 start_codon:yes stop_codon:yes gene_type:complete
METVLKFKINLKKSRVPKYIPVPKTLIEGKFLKGKLPNFLDFKTTPKNSIFLFAYNKSNNSLRSIDTYEKTWHGIYNSIQFKNEIVGDNGKKIKKLYQEISDRHLRFVNHLVIIKHYITFDTLKRNYTLINKQGYFFSYDKDNKNKDRIDYKNYGHSYIWMDFLEEVKSNKLKDIRPDLDKKITNKKSLNEALKIIAKPIKKSPKFFSRRVQDYDKILYSDLRYDLILLAKKLHELKYDLIKGGGLSLRIYFFKFFDQFCYFYGYNKNIKNVSKRLIEVIEIMYPDKDQKKIMMSELENHLEYIKN